MRVNTFALIALLLLMHGMLIAQPLPGAGQRVTIMSDDFEDPSWTFNRDGNFGGISSNGKWFGAGPPSDRGTPEVIEHLPTPAGGPAGSSYALRLRSTDNDGDGTSNQEDFHFQYASQLFGRPFARSDLPSFTTYVNIPALDTLVPNVKNLGFRVQAHDDELNNGIGGLYYPSIWIGHTAIPDSFGPPGARLLARLGDGISSDETVGRIDQAGWWSLGLSFGSDGVGHYFASPGTDALTAADKIYDTSRFPNRPSFFAPPAPLMDRVSISFFSLSYQGKAPNALSPDFAIDEFSTYIVPEPGGSLSAFAWIAVWWRRL